MDGIRLAVVDSIYIFDGSFWTTFIEERELGCKIKDKCMNYIPYQDKYKENSPCWATLGTKLSFFLLIIFS